MDFNTSILSGPTAFYNEQEYATNTQNWAPAKVKYTYKSPPTKSEPIIVKIAKLIFNIIFIVPILIYKAFYALARVAVVPSASIFAKKYSRLALRNLRNNICIASRLDLQPFDYKRLTIEVDGVKIDAAIVGQASTLANKRWVLGSVGNGDFYENNITPGHDFTNILTKTYANGLIFNYPGAGASEGVPNRDTLAKVYKAMLTFLEDQTNGIGAKEIIGYGHSIGGGVQAEALQTHEMKKDVKYVFVKSRTFSKISRVITPLSYLLIPFGWNINTIDSSKTLRAPEIITQGSLDHVIKERASLAYALKKDDKHLKDRKTHIYLDKTEHMEAMSFENTNNVAAAINHHLSNYPKDSHVNMKNFKSYVESAEKTNRLQVIKEILEENKVETDVTLFGTRVIKLQGAGTVSLKWLSQKIKENTELKLKWDQYFKDCNTQVNKRNFLTRLFTKIQDYFLLFKRKN